MKRIAVLFFLLIWTLTPAQDQLARADMFFERSYYPEAIERYEQVVKNNRDATVVANLAQSYMATFQHKKAAKWLEYLIKNHASVVGDEHYHKLAHCYKALGDTDRANTVLLNFYAQTNLKEREVLLEDIAYLENVAAMGGRFKINTMGLNSSTSEFPVAISGSVLIVAAAKKEGGFLKKQFAWNEQHYLDLYSANLNKLAAEDSTLIPFSKTLNSKMHEGGLALAKDGKTLYFIRNNFAKGRRKDNGDKVSTLKIYQAKWVDGKWSEISELPFNGDDFSTAHPALSPDGKTLFFSSDRPGGFGSFDLYKVTVDNGSYGTPKNMGALLNTDKREQFPFMDAEGKLYFASDGHPSFGLLDVFVADVENGQFKKPDNVGQPVNSGFDDFAYLVNENGKGFFASNRKKGRGSDDIYAFEVIKPLAIKDCGQTIAGTITDRNTQEVLPSSSVSLYKKQDGMLVETQKTDSEGRFEFAVACAEAYRVTATMARYIDGERTITSTKVRAHTLDASMALRSVAEQEKKKLEQEQKRLAQEEATHKEEALQKKKLALQKGVARKKEIANIVKNNQLLVKEKDRTVIDKGEIHFDYSLWYLRRESRKRLIPVVQLLKEHPAMVIEIGTHTDIRGDATYNKELSQKRADVVRDFLIENGIPQKQVIATGYGEARPLVACKTVAACTEEDHEWNRRCELVVVSWE